MSEQPQIAPAASGEPGDSGDPAGDPASPAEALNRLADCWSLDRARLRQILEPALDAAGPGQGLLDTHPTLLAPVPVFLGRAQVDGLREIVRAVDQVTALPAYRERALEGLPDTVRIDRGTLGGFLGFDFHLSPEGPQLIEINTNPGGGLLEAYLRRAQDACCDSVARLVDGGHEDHSEGGLVDVLLEEWQRERPDRPPRTVAIVDDAPDEQFLQPEMRLFAGLLEQRGLRAWIADPSDLVLRDGTLRLGDEVIDLVYNRLTDFYLEEPRHAALRDALRAGAAVVTPTPRAHALFANKRNLVTLSDPETLRALGATPEQVASLARGVPRTVRVTPERADELWAARKDLFFKPLAGFAGRGTYRGSKLTRRVWQSILETPYVAQRRIAPTERNVRVDGGDPEALKLDVRAHSYDGRLLLLGARLYRGQTTNLRTPGGGLAPVLTTA